MMAPTGILAEQHYATLQSLLEPLGLRVGLLTGSMRASEKKRVKAQLASGELAVCVGTHALLSQGVEFAKIGCVITDEQHRFGVGQRLSLQQKAENPHVMVMSATPIPRTLALIIYGDLDVSVLDELPPGRQPIETYRINSAKRARALRFIQKHLDEGLQAYIVCPLVEAGEGENAGNLKDATATRAAAGAFFSGYRWGFCTASSGPRKGRNHAPL
jgi:ATP-dependent DNA helicase RecG